MLHRSVSTIITDGAKIAAWIQLTVSKLLLLYCPLYRSIHWKEQKATIVIASINILVHLIMTRGKNVRFYLASLVEYKFQECSHLKQRFKMQSPLLMVDNPWAAFSHSSRVVGNTIARAPQSLIANSTTTLSLLASIELTPVTWDKLWQVRSLPSSHTSSAASSCHHEQINDYFGTVFPSIKKELIIWAMTLASDFSENNLKFTGTCLSAKEMYIFFSMCVNALLLFVPRMMHSVSKHV